MYLAFNALYALLSIPSGILADRLGKERIIQAGFGLFAGIYAGFALGTTPWQIAGLFALYGIHMGLTEGVHRAYVATLVPGGRKAMGFGLYHVVVGLAILPASLIAGALWDSLGPAAPFWFGAVMAMLAAVCFVGISWKSGDRPVRPCA
jgi:MFS family permease